MFSFFKWAFTKITFKNTTAKSFDKQLHIEEFSVS